MKSHHGTLKQESPPRPAGVPAVPGDEESPHGTAAMRRPAAPAQPGGPLVVSVQPDPRLLVRGGACQWRVPCCFFRPSMTGVTYHGSYHELNGVRMSEAYKSTLDISFDVRGGLLMRQVHRWSPRPRRSDDQSPRRAAGWWWRTTDPCASYRVCPACAIETAVIWCMIASGRALATASPTDAASSRRPRTPVPPATDTRIAITFLIPESVSGI